MGTEAGDKDTMQRPPRSPQSRILSSATNRYILIIGGLIGAIALGLGVFAFNADHTSWQTMIFTSIAFMQVGQALASRSSTESLFALGWWTNPVLLGMSIIVIILQLIAVLLPLKLGK